MDDWSIIQNQAKKLLETKAKFRSLGGLVEYCFYYVGEDVIVLDRLNGGDYAKIGRLGALNSIQKLKVIGQMHKANLISDVIRQTALVMLHPNIYYDDNSKQIIWREKRLSNEILEQLINQAKDDELEKIQVQINKRKNQSKFRLNILKLYKQKCAISNTDVEDVLDAAHIISHSKSGINKSDNGILLRSDLHILFDRNLILIEPTTYDVLVSEILKNTPYYNFHKMKLQLPITNEFLLKKWVNKDFA